MKSIKVKLQPLRGAIFRGQQPKTTYQGLPDFYPKEGEILSHSQLEMMLGKTDRDWRAEKQMGDEVLIDFLDSNGFRNDCLECGKNTFGRFILKQLNGAFWVVTRTSYA